MKKKFSFLSYKIITIPLGEDDIFFKNSGIPNFNQKLSFIFGGEFRRGKNQKLLIKSFYDFLQNTKLVDSRLYLPGVGKYRNECMKFASELGIEGNVFFPGQVDRLIMLELYNKCQVAIIPSNQETFGHCIAEPFVLKKIIVSKNIGLAIDYLVDKRNGFIFSSFIELTKILIDISKMDAIDLERMSLASGNVGINFDWNTIANKHLNMLFK